jgi:multidrug transporter EmrE-like cation transporter
MNWLACILTGALLTALLGAFFRGNPFSLSISGMVIVSLPFSILAQFAFARAFNTAPVFFIAWFTGSAACALGACFFSRLIFDEKFFPLDGLGIVLVLAGAALLARGG